MLRQFLLTEFSLSERNAKISAVKIFCFIFIVQVFAVLAFPCEEVFPDVVENYSAAHATSISDGSATQSLTDECTLLCICSCCGHPVANPSISITVKPRSNQSVAATLATEYSNPYTANHSNLVWQPPKA